MVDVGASSIFDRPLAGCTSFRQETARIHSYETGSTVDPGVRAMVSCPVACCAVSLLISPDTWHLKDGTRIERRGVAALATSAGLLRCRAG
jgi:pyruvate formate lyase activating enzyme